MAPLNFGLLTNSFGGSEAHILTRTVEEGKAGYGACSHVYLLFDFGVDAHLTVRIRTYFQQLQGHILVFG